MPMDLVNTRTKKLTVVGVKQYAVLWLMITEKVWDNSFAYAHVLTIKRKTLIGIAFQECIGVF